MKGLPIRGAGQKKGRRRDLQAMNLAGNS